MSKVFNLYDGSEGEDWFDIQAYGQGIIDRITDPNGETSRHQITSIPSPFARISLVNEAFRFVSWSKEHPNLQGNTIYHKMVSDALDLAELLFHYDELSPRIRVFKWQRDGEIKLLTNNDQHNLYGKTLSLFLGQDGNTFNFDELNNIFLFEFDNRIIGGTSPLTIYFTSSNELSWIDVRMDNDRLFDADYNPLYNRSINFIKYLTGFRKFFPRFSELFLNFNYYLEKNLNIISNDLRNEIREMDEDSYHNQFAELDTGIANDPVTLFGFSLRKLRYNKVDSDFQIVSEKYKRLFPENDLPLALQNNFSRPYRYINDIWNPQQEVPHYDPAPLERRTLPGQTITYPYLTVNDFLLPVLVKLPFPVNKEKYFDGNLSSAGTEFNGYLLPITKKFFDFFDSDALLNLVDGIRMISIENCGNYVSVHLNIPVNGGHVTFEKRYIIRERIQDNYAKIIESEKDGVVIECQINITVMPFFRLNDQEQKYLIQLSDVDTSNLLKDLNYSLVPFSKDNQQLSDADNLLKRTRSNKKVFTISSDYYWLSKEFDYFRIRAAKIDAVIIPIMQNLDEGNRSFTFAVDFGTSYTHIEYHEDGEQAPKSFNIESESEKQYESLCAIPHDQPHEFSAIIEKEMFPELVGNNSFYKFPTRTAIAYTKGINYKRSLFALSDMNIPFFYEKDYELGHMETKPNLKWAKHITKETDESRKHIQAFYEHILLMIRNKVLLNNGSIDKTRLIWFYPSSMLEGRVDSLKSIWDKLFSRYFINADKPVRISESLAPFFFFKNNDRITSTVKPVISIDIGGGTCDVVVYENNLPVKLTSFKYGADIIYGDGFSRFTNAKNHGVVKKYYPIISELLNKNGLGNLIDVLNNVMIKTPQDVIAFFYSLANNPYVLEKHLQDELDFSNMLKRDSNIKVIFIFYLSSILYHIGKFLKANKIGLPRYVTFSGTGSKLLSIITNDTKKIEGITIQILQDILELQYDSDGLNIIESQSPKEVTCKGGLMSSDLDKYNGETLKSIYFLDDKILSNDFSYADLDDENLNGIVTEVKDFITYFLGLWEKFDFGKKFEISTQMDQFTKVISKDLKANLKEGLEQKKDELLNNLNQKIEEPLFFYPLIGCITNFIATLSHEK